MNNTYPVRVVRRLLEELGLDTLASVAVGIVVKTALGPPSTWAARTIIAPTAGLTVANGSGVGGNPTLALANNLAALEAVATTGLLVETGVDTVATRSLVAPAAGMTIANGDGVAGNPTFSLANGLLSIESLATTGPVVQQAADTFVTYNPAIPGLTAGPKVGAAILVSVAIKSVLNVTLAQATRCTVQLYSADFVPSLVGAFTATIGGGGTAVSTDVRPGMVFQTDAGGLASLTITDVSGIYAGLLYVVVTPMVASGVSFRMGEPAILQISFA